MRRRILVTGGAGYIGAHTALQIIKAGHEPVVLDNLMRSDLTLVTGVEYLADRKLRFVNGDCTDVDLLRRVFSEYSFDAVMHFAALKSVEESVREPLLYYRNNVGSMTSLLEVMLEYKVRDLIFSSSCTVYGQPDVIPVTELAPMKKAASPYGSSKQMCERILADTYRKGLRVISLRYFNPIGAHPSSFLGELPVGVPANLVPFITQTAIGKREKLVVFGDDYDTPDGSCIRDYIHVMDVANAHVAALDHIGELSAEPFYDVFNLGAGTGVTVLELANKFKSVTGVDLRVEIGPRRPGDVESIYADPTKANKTLKWKTKLTVEDALRDAWNWEQKLAQSRH